MTSEDAKGKRSDLDEALEMVEQLPGSRASADVEALAIIVLDLKARLEALEKRETSKP
jgi:hypothetical protein